MAGSDFFVLHPSAQALQVVASGFGLLNLMMLFFGVAALGGLWVIWRGIVIKSAFGIALGAFWMCLFGFFALMGRPTTSTLLLDRAGNEVTAVSAGLIFGHDHYAVPLDQVRHAHLDRGRSAAKRIVLILKSGQHFGFTAFTDRGGQEEAVQAINDFLGVEGD